MKVNVVTKVTINASAPEVYKYLTDLKYNSLWNPQIKKLSSLEVLKLNSMYETTSHILGVTIRAQNVVTKFVPNKELQLENITGTIQYVANFKLTAKSKSSQLLICTTTVSSESKAFAFTVPVLRRLARRELQTDLQALKIAVENRMPSQHP